MTHHYTTLKNAKRSTTTISWPVCKRCGLVLLHNKVSSDWARLPCPGKEDK